MAARERPGSESTNKLSIDLKATPTCYELVGFVSIGLCSSGIGSFLLGHKSVSARDIVMTLSWRFHEDKCTCVCDIESPVEALMRIQSIYRIETFTSVWAGSIQP